MQAPKSNFFANFGIILPEHDSQNIGAGARTQQRLYQCDAATDAPAGR
jgi:hypothetical protein